MVDQVHAVLREQILTGALPRGSRLPQETIAAELGVSRTPLREALRRLASEGLVTLQPNHGATVSGVDFNDMNAAWVARLAIEPFAARLAAERRDPDELERMATAIARAARGVCDPADGLDANREFHLALVAASGNDHLAHFAELLWVTRISFAIYAAQASESDGVEAWADEHEQILAAITAGDADLRRAAHPHPPRSAIHRWSTRDTTWRRARVPETGLDGGVRRGRREVEVLVQRCHAVVFGGVLGGVLARCPGAPTLTHREPHQRDHDHRQRPVEREPVVGCLGVGAGLSAP